MYTRIAGKETKEKKKNLGQQKTRESQSPPQTKTFQSNAGKPGKFFKIPQNKGAGPNPCTVGLQ
jgi:hypothetical protein